MLKSMCRVYVSEHVHPSLCGRNLAARCLATVCPLFSLWITLNHSVLFLPMYIFLKCVCQGMGKILSLIFCFPSSAWLNKISTSIPQPPFRRLKLVEGINGLFKEKQLPSDMSASSWNLDYQLPLRSIYSMFITDAVIFTFLRVHMQNEGMCVGGLWKTNASCG